MKASSDKKVRGRSLVPGNRKSLVNPDPLDTFTFDNYIEHDGNAARLFDEEGLLRAREKGVKHFHFAKLSLFHALQSHSWLFIIGYSALLYLLILFVFSVGYLLWASFCGASREGVRWTTALYFTIVSLAANGGYMGEPSTTMTEPNSMCFTGRTILVMILSYSNIIFVGLVAALVVAKAGYAGKLGQRIVFSDFCTLTTVSSNPGHCWRLTFRMANSNTRKPIAHGRLQVFVVTTEPLKNFQRRRKETQRTASVKKSIESGTGAAHSDPAGHPRHRHHRRHRRHPHAEHTTVVEMEKPKSKPDDNVTTTTTPLLLVPDMPASSTWTGPVPGGGASDSEDSVKSNSSTGSRSAAGNGGFERVCTCVEEVRWTCPEERYLDARTAQLALWFPVSIHHTIDRRSPLYRLVGALEGGAGSDANRSPEPSMETAAQGSKSHQAKQSFQIVATFDAVELHSGATITAKRIYTMNDIVTHYRFSNKVVHLRPRTHEVQLDYHHFNEMLPVAAVESSTTDSDILCD